MDASLLIAKPWDSQLFGYQIGQTTHFTDESLREALIQAQQQGFRLIYGIFAGGNHPSEAICQAFGGKHVDTKVVFGKPFPNSLPDDSAISGIVSPSDSDLARIRDLALQSGEFSRFRTDPQMNQREFEKLYDIWIEKSLSGEIADEVLVTRDAAGTVTGMVTYQVQGEVVEIGLIGVDHSTRGQGLGTRLVERVCQLASAKGCTHLRVATQRANAAACAFYRRVGCTITEEKEIYHFWH